jgi:hypothetical protein
LSAVAGSSTAYGTNNVGVTVASSAAYFKSPLGITWSPAAGGTLFVSDTNNYVRKKKGPLSCFSFATTHPFFAPFGFAIPIHPTSPLLFFPFF